MVELKGVLQAIKYKWGNKESETQRGQVTSSGSQNQNLDPQNLNNCFISFSNISGTLPSDHYNNLP